MFKEIVQALEVDQPLCSKDYGTSNTAGSCSAKLGITGTCKCFKTRITCQDPASYLPGTRFSTITVTIASPAVVTWTAHGLLANTPVVFGTSGALPTGITAGTRYYVKSPATDTFQISATPGGASINTSGSQSGTHRAIAQLPLTVRWLTKQANTQKYYNGVPTITGMTTAPQTVNLAGMDRSSELLGDREVVTVQLENLLHSDAIVDPYRLERQTGVSSEKYLSLPGQSGDYASTPDTAANSITTDLAIRAKVSPADWTPAAISALVAKWSASKGYKLELLTDAKLRLSWSTDGAATTSKDSTVAVAGVVDGVAMWVAATLDVNNGAAGNDVKFWKSTDFNPANGTGTWTQVGTTVTTGGTTSIFNSTATLTVGAEADGTTGVWAGKAHYADVFNGLTLSSAAAAAFDPQPAADRATSFAAPLTGETWTINQSGSPKAELIAVHAPYDSYIRGTQLGKWIARNPYCVGYPVRVYDGEMGQALSSMPVRYLLLDRIDGPSSGKVTLQAADLFARVSRRKAVCPAASKGELFADITGSPATFQVFPTGVGSEYLSSGYVCIGDEVIQYTRSGDTFTVVTRAALGTTQDDHKDEDLVQQVAVFSSMTGKDITYALLVNEVTGNAGLPSTAIDSAAWTAASTGMTELYTGYIAKPTPIKDLIAELEEIVGFTVIPDVMTGMVDFVPLRGTAPGATFTKSNIVKGSIKPRRLDTRRVSRALIHYAPKSPTVSLDDESNFRSRLEIIDLASEGEDQHGSPSIKTIFCRWIPQFGRSLAEAAGTRIIGLFRDPPLEINFRVNGDQDIALGSAISIDVPEIEDKLGDQLPTTHAVVRLERDIKKNQIALRTLETRYTTTVIDRTVYISEDVTDFNFRTTWEALFGTPVSGDTAKVVLLSGIFVGGGSTGGAAYAFDIGTWPSGVTLLAQIDGEVLPLGGVGGAGGTITSAAVGISSAAAGSVGGNGAPGLRTAHALTLSGAGVIRGGWPGGGGGGGGRASSSLTPVDPDDYQYWGTGGGGGGGRGFPGGAGGAPGFDNGVGGFGVGGGPGPASQDATAGGTGTRTAQGSSGLPGIGNFVNNRQYSGGAGGAGNGSGASAFQVTAQSMTEDNKAGAGPGTRGFAITGNSLVTQSGWTGTIDGATTG